MVTILREPHYRLAPHNDTERYARRYRETGRAHIDDLMREPDAQKLYATLTRHTDWTIRLVGGVIQGYEMPEREYAALDEAERNVLSARLFARARQRFAGRYRMVPLSVDGKSGGLKDNALKRIVDFLNGAEFLALARAVTETPGIKFADVQLTRYDPGDFLLRHADDKHDETRKAAYVLNLTPQWRAEWGGLLAFPDRRGHVAEAIKPCWNALNIFRVPQDHYVSYVNPIAPVGRYSVMGWLRSR